ncbi:MAG: HNH endonuclease signature motif containing protein [bacterium]
MKVTEAEFSSLLRKVSFYRKAAEGRLPDRRPARPRAKRAATGRVSPSLLVKAIKKRILGTGGLWSLAVRKRDKYQCVMCGKTEGLSAHHWLFRRAHSMALACDINNGTTLCFGCHLGRIHGDGDGDFMLRLAARMQAIVGDEKIGAMRVVAINPQPLGLDWWREAEVGLRYYLEGPS